MFPILTQTLGKLNVLDTLLNGRRRNASAQQEIIGLNDNRRNIEPAQKIAAFKAVCSDKKNLKVLQANRDSATIRFLKVRARINA